MEDLVEQIARGNVSAVKVVLTCAVMALAVYQVFLMAVTYGKVKLPFLTTKAASFTHRASGDTIVVVTLIVGFMCLAYFGIEDGIEHAQGGEHTRVGLHVVFGWLLAAAIVLKVIVVRWWHRMGRFLPAIGLSVFTLFLLTWITSAADVLWGGR